MSEAPRSAAELEALQEQVADEFDDGFSERAAERGVDGLVEIRPVFQPA